MKNALKQFGIAGILLITPLLSIGQANARPIQAEGASIQLQSRVKLTPLCSPNYPDCPRPVRRPVRRPVFCNPQFCDPSPIQNIRIREDELIIPADRIRDIGPVIQQEPVRQIEDAERFRQGNSRGFGLKDLYDD